MKSKYLYRRCIVYMTLNFTRLEKMFPYMQIFYAWSLNKNDNNKNIVFQCLLFRYNYSPRIYITRNFLSLISAIIFFIPTFSRVKITENRSMPFCWFIFLGLVSFLLSILGYFSRWTAWTDSTLDYQRFAKARRLLRSTIYSHYKSLEESH